MRLKKIMVMMMMRITMIKMILMMMRRTMRMMI